MPDFQELCKKVQAFVDERNWQKYQNPKDLALSAMIELGELLEHVQWKTDEEILEYLKTHKEDVSDELADVFVYLIEFANATGIDAGEAVETKLKKNAIKYPVSEFFGKHTNKK